MDEKELARAKNAAYRYLSARPRSCAEVESKLRDKGFDDVVIRAVLSHLIRLGYVDDEKFASQWVESRIRLRGFGRRRIEQELRDKGVDREVVRRALAEVLTTELELETVRKAATKKLQTLRALDREIRKRRLAGFLERKGFSYDVIREVLQSTENSINQINRLTR